MDQLIRDFLLLTASALNQTALRKEQVADMNLRGLFIMSHGHMMTTMLACALEAAGVQNEEFRQARRREEIRLAVVQHGRAVVEEALAKEHIWYMTLKGSLLMDLYPVASMRQMSDVDILFDPSREEDMERVMKNLGFTLMDEEWEHHKGYWKPPFTYVEMHTMLFDEHPKNRLHDFFSEIEKRLPGEREEKHLSDEDFYLYLIAHEFKHFCWHGVGVRSLADTYVFLKHHQDGLDWDYIREGCGKLRITTFERENRELAMKLFQPNGIETLTAEQLSMLDHFVKLQEKALQRFRKRMFMPIEMVEFYYPFFFDHRAFLPLLPIWRLVRGKWIKPLLTGKNAAHGH